MIFYRHPVIYQQITMTPEEPVVVVSDDPIVDDVPMVVRPDVFYSSAVKAEQIELEEPGWDQAFNPPLVPVRKIPPSVSVIGDEVPVIDSGWDQAYSPPLVPARVIPPSSTIIVQEVAVPVVEEPGWDQAFNPPLVPARKIPPSSLAFVDEVAIIDSGWDQAFSPPLVPARKIPPSSLAFVDEVAEIDSGWVQDPDPPPLFLFVARFVPVSSSTMSALEEPAPPGVAAARMRLLGGGLLRRKQLG